MRKEREAMGPWMADDNQDTDPQPSTGPKTGRHGDVQPKSQN